jgi:hypothetical protein
LLGIVVEFDEEFFEFMVRKMTMIGVVGIGLRSLLEDFFDLIDLDCLPKILELRNVDRFQIAA